MLLLNDKEAFCKKKKHKKKQYPIQDWTAQTIPYFRPKWLNWYPIWEQNEYKTFIFLAAYTNKAQKKQYRGGFNIF